VNGLVNRIKKELIVQNTVYWFVSIWLIDSFQYDGFF
jgi:hypothetical protein